MLSQYLFKCIFMYTFIDERVFFLSNLKPGTTQESFYHAWHYHFYLIKTSN